MIDHGNPLPRYPESSPEEEERMIEEPFQDVLNRYLNSTHRKKVEIIERA